jgi:hypothetical protein
MIMIAKRFVTFISPRNLGLSSSKVHCSPRKLAFPWGTIMLSERTFFPLENMVALHDNSNLAPLGTTMFPKEQLKAFFTSI